MTSTRDDRHGPGVRIHPPVIIAVVILAGLGLGSVRPLTMPWDINGKYIGGAILVMGGCLALWALYQFHRVNSDVRPDRPDTILITTGPYRYTRNPLYIVLSMIQVAAAFWLDNLWILLLLPLSVIVIRLYAIAREERYLEETFGQDYLDYRKRVRRWF